MLAYLAIARAFLARVPWQVWIALAVAIAAFVIWQAGKGAGASKEQAKQAVIERKAVETARQADSVAQDTVEVKTNAVERRNQRARKAAADGPDPLRDALRVLREEQTRADPSAAATGDVR